MSERNEVVSPEISAPNAWLGEKDCFVGPFTSERVAAYYAAQMVNSYDTDALAGNPVEQQGDWYIKIESRARVERDD